jgi:signal transduction histidine kinase
VTRRTARVLSVGVLTACILATAVSIPVNVASRDRVEPGHIAVVGDPTTPGMQRVIDELEAERAAGGTLEETTDGSVNPIFGVLLLLLLLWIGIGVLIVSRQPANWAGWLFIVTGVPFPLISILQALVIYGVKADPGSVPLIGLWATVGEYALYPIALLPLLFLLYPDGHPPTPRWRWAVVGLVGGTTLAALGFVARPGPYNNWIADGIVYENPLGIDAAADIAPVVITIGTVIALASALSAVVAVVLRFRRSTGEDRQRMRVLAFVAAIAGTSFALMWILGLLFFAIGGEDDEGTVFEVLFGLTVLTVALGIPLAYAVAIFRYRLYDLDLVIRKTVQYAVLVGAIMLVGFVVLAAVPTLLFGVDRNANVAPTLIVATLMTIVFLWLRPRALRLADRLVYGKRATPYEVLSEFSERVGDTYSTEDVLPRMAQLVAEATGARRADVWLRVGSELRPEASWPGVDAPVPRPLSARGVEPVANEHATEVRHQGDLLGAITLEPSPDDPIDPAKEALVRDLAAQAGLVLRNVGLIEELRASRRRLVAAQDEERRKLERNIHDGVQQQLVALSVQLRLAEQLTERDPERAAEVLRTLQGRSNEALEDLRDLARGIYPPLLADQGLASALEAQARKSPVPVTVEVDDITRYPRAIESAVYFSCLEALNNVAKYAEATRVRIALSQRNGTLTFSVTDDGQGFDASNTSHGTGLQGIADRLDAIGGALHVESELGRGSKLSGSIPAEPAG